MGSRAQAPPLPAFEILDVPEDEIKVSFVQRDCNWLQALEGEIDTSHFGFLHAGHVDADDLSEDEPICHTVTNRAPEYHVADTPWGTQYAGYREAGPGRTYWRFANFLFPFWTQAPNGEFGSHMHARGWVPLDDDHTMFCYLWWKRGTSSMTLPQPAFKDGRPIGGTGRGRQAPAQHDRLARSLATGGECRQRLGDRPRGPAEQRHLQRHRRHPPAGPGDHREHGPDHRPRLRASGAVGPDDRAHAPAPVDGGARACAIRVPAARCRGRRRLSWGPQRLLRQRRHEPLARGLRQAAGRVRASANPIARGGVDGAAPGRGVQLTRSRPRPLRAALANWKMLSHRSSRTSRASLTGITVNLPLSRFNRPKR